MGWCGHSWLRWREERQQGTETPDNWWKITEIDTGRQSRYTAYCCLTGAFSLCRFASLCVHFFTSLFAGEYRETLLLVFPWIFRWLVLFLSVPGHRCPWQPQSCCNNWDAATYICLSHTDAGHVIYQQNACSGMFRGGVSDHFKATSGIHHLSWSLKGGWIT